MAMNMNRRSVASGGIGHCGAAAARPRLARRVRRGTARSIVRIEKDISNLDPANRVGLGRGQHHPPGLPDPGALQAGQDSDWEPDAAKTITQVIRDRDRVRAQSRPDVPWRLWRDDRRGREILARALHQAGPMTARRLAYADDFGALDQVEVTGNYTGRSCSRIPAPALWVIGLCDGSGAILSKKATERAGRQDRHHADRLRPLSGQGVEAQRAARRSRPTRTTRAPTSRISSASSASRSPSRKTALLAFLAKELAFTEIEPTAVAEIEADPEFGRHQARRHRLRLDRHQYREAAVRPTSRCARRSAYGIDVDAIIAGAYSGTVSRAKTLLAPRPARPLGGRARLSARCREGQGAAGRSRPVELHMTLTCLNDAHLAGRSPRSSRPTLPRSASP